MLTPKFSLTQDSEFIYIHIHAPYIRLSEAECFVDDDEFRFYANPYYLRLHFPGKIQEDEKSTSKYDVDTGQLTVRVTKQTKSEHFEGLNLLTKLLTPKTNLVLHASPEIEVLTSDVAAAEVPETEEDEENWYIEQNLQEDDHVNLSLTGPKYGFANRKSNCLNRVASEITDLIDLHNPDEISQKNRRELREQQEDSLFDCEHYLADLFDDDIIQELFAADYKDLTGVVGEHIVLSDKENEKLINLPRRDYVIEKNNLEATYLGLVDLMLAYAYTFRFTHGDFGIESDWTICKLSSTLSWLDTFQSIDEVVVSFARRCLVFPLYRNWKLFEKVLSDVKSIFNVGKLQILKCLLGIHSVLLESEVKHPLNDLYITDYCVWIQIADAQKIKTMSEALSNIAVSKSDLNFKLEEMEADAMKLMAENDDTETEDEKVCSLMKAFDKVVTLKIDETSDSDDSSDEEEEEENDAKSSDSSDISSQCDS
ncbi:protein SHQ1 homolog [Biomphalaria glabrata]|uniref:Protein SHQ1 homolog n=1 Tax=Biomphalaria glabrata TaxID=6526 RepID=A0A9U8EET0_BIOGL|nr:protein SHQ1 homolog [Biomphalaria glabrata]